MKQLFQIACFILVFDGVAIAQKSNCSRTCDFGKARICLPMLEGYQECYLEPTVKEHADLTEVPANMVLGYYLNNASYEKQLSGSLERFEDYFKVYGTKQVQDYEADKSVLLMMKEMLAGNFIATNWDKIKEAWDSESLGFEVGVPVIIKSYDLNEASFTYLMVVKYALEDGSTYSMVMAMNGVLLKQRLVWVAYYLEYDGESSIKRLEQQSNHIVEQLLKDNL